MSSKTVTVGQDSSSTSGSNAPLVHKDLVANSPEIIAANNSIVYLRFVFSNGISFDAVDYGTSKSFFLNSCG